MQFRWTVWAACVGLLASAASAATVATVVNAQPRAGLDTIECRQALQGLQREEARVAEARRRDGMADRPGGMNALRTAQRQAALACLGGPPDVPAPPRAAQPSMAAPPPASTALPAPLPPSRAEIPAPPRPSAPITLGACDATGCWASDGTRLQRVGPNLLGPRGLCTTAGSVVNCP